MIAMRGREEELHDRPRHGQANGNNVANDRLRSLAALLLGDEGDCFSSETAA